MAIKDYSTDPDQNVKISGINIAEGCAPSGINNAIRQLMADVKAESDARTTEDAAQDSAISNAATAAANAQSSANAAQQSADAAQTTADSALAAAEEAASKAGLPLGFEYTRLTGQTPPFGGVDYLGQTATRAMYADLWAWLQANKPDAIVSESEWQSLYSSQNGNVAKYSTGDGSTTFRFPRMVGYAKGAASASEIGGYTTEGLPNITGEYSPYGWRLANEFSGITGAFYCTASNGGERPMYSSTGNAVSLLFDASRSNAIYGNSDHVTPETVTVVMGVIAIGAVAEIGTATEAGLVAEVAEISGNVGALQTGSGFNAAGKAEIVGWGMPDYSAGVQQSLQTEYTATMDGVIQFTLSDYNTTSRLELDGVSYLVAAMSSNQLSFAFTQIAIPRGTRYKVACGRTDVNNFLYFFPLKGA